MLPTCFCFISSWTTVPITFMSITNTMLIWWACKYWFWWSICCCWQVPLVIFQNKKKHQWISTMHGIKFQKKWQLLKITITYQGRQIQNTSSSSYLNSFTVSQTHLLPTFFAPAGHCVRSTVTHASRSGTYTFPSPQIQAGNVPSLPSMSKNKY